jgi:alkyl sulfatase BDS1-like metallo-beta-lactamase superfamily hydrolase
MWDQTVRALNRGDTADEIAHAVRLPDFFDDDYLTTEFYGVTEHHVRQIAAGLRGWFDGDPSKLFPLEPTERFTRLVEGFGGCDVVRRIVAESIDADDLRWALELATWLTRIDGSTDDDRRLLAKVLREIGYRSSAANIRNWCLTAARDIDGSHSLDRLRKHRIREAAVNAGTTVESLDQLRVTLDPVRALGIDHHIGLRIADDPESVGLHVRNCVAVVTDSQGATDHVRTDRATWASILAGRVHLDDAMTAGSLTIVGDVSNVVASLSVFDVEGLTR